MSALFAEEIRAEMGRQHVDSTQLGQRIGRSRDYVRRRIIGLTPLNVDDVGLMCEALGLPFGELVGRLEATPIGGRL